MDRIVVVTGAGQGIGRATVEAFCRAGDTVIATSRDPSAAAWTAPEGSGTVERAALDVTDGAAVAAFAADVLGRYGRLDVLVNNAGQGFTGTTEDLSIADISRSLDVNFLGAVRMTKAFLPAMRERRRGWLIGVSSIGGAVGQPFNDAYCAAKFALEGLYESLQPVAAALGVHVSLVQPGPVQSDHRNRAVATRSTVPEIAEMQARHTAMSETTFERAQASERVAEVVLAVADDPAPVLRYQTSRLVSRLVGAKLKDLSGEEITSITAGWIAP